MTNTVAVEVNNVYKVFGKRPRDVVKRLKAGATRNELSSQGTAAVIDASFEVRKGEIFVVMGLSGSGKSTLIRMLNGLLEPTSGSVAVYGSPVSGIPAKQLREVRRSKISMVFQHFALLPHRTVLDNAAYALEVQGVPVAERRERAQKVVSRVGLAGWENKLPGELSGGMQQRVGLARALAADTDVLLMDEAFSALDPLIRREMQEQLVDLQHELGKTIIFITHDLNEAMFLGDRIAVMRDGRVVQVGTPDEILTDPANDYVAQFVQDVDRARVLTAASVMEPARSVVSGSAGPRAALRSMRDLQTSAAFVVGNGRKLLGVVHDRDLLKHVKAGNPDLMAIVRNDPATVGPDQYLVDLFEPAAESQLPVAVVDDKGRLLGAIPRVTLLAALANVPTTTGENQVIETPATVAVEIITQTLRETAGLTDETEAPKVTTADEGSAAREGSLA
ncbi:glycine betaine/proline transport system ATP-binding protein [Okibacterium sp. HSC-33S16]|uniref:quaternary amine ABC transporter ATP-binding protein n=1 Tax=Okibacterium sp. HSC-33S16 TaxID=2910965 RepID=UPI0020A152CA|nr:glycine betaine/L-proline ABC transporter ATP-binding protein [Okibacterium sp. HSC-33S16]MCP2031278.1 glycine betaine/proline transport system ATP-binding protein [Okibacterium sp. HSC-33S16]